MNPLKWFFSLLLATLVSQSFAQVSDYFNKIKTNPVILYDFLKQMPKGGELHYHLAGGAYPEAMMRLAAINQYCLQKKTFNILPFSNTCDNEHSATELTSKPALYKKTLQAWSMEDFTPGKESGHDHFFNSFDKFMPLVANHRSSLLVDVLERAASQNELYLEIMILPDDAQSLSGGELIKQAKTLQQKQGILLADKGFQNIIQLTKNKSAQILKEARKELGCEKNLLKPACQIKVKFQYYVLREQALDNLFAQALNGFAAVADSDDLVAVNLVLAEDGPVSLRDYQKQMALFKFLHKAYPKVHIALHAGELAPGLAKPSDLKSHIRDALLMGQAERIGHGVDIQQEALSDNTANYMAKKQIPVEINLTSNQKILSITGKKHPLNFYLKKKVPVVLSTDDEGILRTDLTHQYLEAVMHHHVDYPALKQMNRNALTYNFLPGKSLWANPTDAIPVKACLNLDSPSCQQFIRMSSKAKLQWQLEKKLNDFEAGY